MGSSRSRYRSARAATRLQLEQGTIAQQQGEPPRGTARRLVCAYTLSRIVPETRWLQWAPVEVAKTLREGADDTQEAAATAGILRHILERQLAVRAEDSDDDDDADRTYAFPPPVDLDAYAAACRLPPAEETEDEREARFQRERCFGL